MRYSYLEQIPGVGILEVLPVVEDIPEVLPVVVGILEEPLVEGIPVVVDILLLGNHKLAVDLALLFFIKI